MLLVEEVGLLREILHDLLASINMQVLEASSAAAAIRIGRSHPGKIDLLLIDLDLRGKSGWDSANSIARMRPGIRILYMSAGISSLEWDGHKEKPAGTYFIQKPFGSKDLKALLMALLAG